MDIATLHAELINRGLSMALADGKLAIAGPIERLTPALKSGLDKHRETLRAMLTPKADAGNQLSDSDSSPAKSETIVSLPPENADGTPDLAYADTPAADGGLRQVGEYFGKLAADVVKHNPKQAANLTADPRGEPCRRCGFSCSVLTLVHDGKSTRRDCATCGRFAEFTTWNDADASARAMADARGAFSPRFP
jgi:hypothetical protein